MLTRNLKYLRRKSGKSQDELAGIFEVNRTTWGCYENGKSDVPVSLLKKVSDHFDVSADDLLNADLDTPLFRSPAKRANLRSEHTRVLAFTVDTQQRENIEFIPVAATAGYSNGYNDPNYIKELASFQLPKLSQGTYRAFEVKGDSMLPIQSGSVIVGQYVESWKDIRNGKRYILALQEEGTVFKRVVSEVVQNNKLILASDNPEYQPFTVNLENVLEAWEMVACIVYNVEGASDYSFVLQKLNTLEQKMNQLLTATIP